MITDPGGAGRHSRNALTLLVGNASSLLLHLAIFAVTARTLGPTDFGALALIAAYAALVDRLVNFQTWQAIVRFGAEAEERRDPAGLRAVLGYCVRLDISTAILGAVAGAAGAFLLRVRLPWLGDHAPMAALYSLTLLLHLRGVTSGVFRLFRAFGIQAWTAVAAATTKLAAVIAVLGAGASSLRNYLLAWIIADVVGSLVEILAARHCVRRNLAAEPPARALSNSERRAIRRFVWLTNLDGMVRVIRDLDLPLIGTQLGLTSAGLYKVARQFADFLMMVVDASYQAVYPELASLAARKDRPAVRCMVLQAGAVLGTIVTVAWVSFVLVGRPILGLVVGQGYAGVYRDTVIAMSAAIVWAVFHPLGPAFLAAGRVGAALCVHLFAAMGYLGGCILLVRAYQLQGAVWAYVGLFTLWGISMTLAGFRTGVLMDPVSALRPGPGPS